ncbi:MAG: nucleoside hydrolase [Synoicihabitans sp.]
MSAANHETEPYDTDLLAWPKGQIDAVFDTDTFNEIDDQFALVYALLSGERINLQAVYAAPFHNNRSSGPGDGMEKSYREIQRVLERVPTNKPPATLKGAQAWLEKGEVPPSNPAVEDLIARARARSANDGRLYVIAVGAITNVAAALLRAPDIRDRIVVLWLGAHPLTWHTAREFNLRGDPVAARVLFDTSVPTVLFPCRNVAEAIKTTPAEINLFVRGKGRIGDYLAEIFNDYHGMDKLAASKAIWDLAPFAWIMDEDWVDSHLVTSPVLNEDLTWSHPGGRHHIREIIYIRRDPVFRDLFQKLARYQ